MVKSESEPAPPKPKKEVGYEDAGGTTETVKSESEMTDPITPVIEAPPPAPVLPPVQVVVEQKPDSKLGSYLWAGSVGVMGFLGQALLVIFLVFFLLLAGDTFKRKLVRIAGSSKSKRKITVSILDDINLSIQRYMLMLLVTNVLVALLTWAALRMIGLENAGAWAVFAGVSHLIPYFGPVVTAGTTAMAAYIQFGNFSMMLLVAGTTLVIATLIGTFVTTWMTGRIAKMNTAAVFISLLFWGWLWGVWGLLLAIPIIAITKVISQHVEELQPVAELLGE
jgi:predicted PurR-regulated permease PerM